MSVGVLLIVGLHMLMSQCTLYHYSFPVIQAETDELAGGVIKPQTENTSVSLIPWHVIGLNVR